MDDKWFKKYILEKGVSNSFKDTSLLVIFLKDRQQYNRLLKKEAIHPMAIRFFKKYEHELDEADTILIDALRDLRFNEIVETFIHEENGRKDKVNTSLEPLFGNGVKPKRIQNLYCPYHHVTLEGVSFIGAKNKDQIIKIPIYQCSVCKELYSLTNIGKHLQRIRVGEYSFTNIWREESNKIPCYVFGNSKPTKCREPSCGGQILNSRIQNGKEKKGDPRIRVCIKCDMSYIPWQIYQRGATEYYCLNPQELPQISKSIDERKDMREANKSARLVETKNNLEKDIKPLSRAEDPKKDSNIMEIQVKDFVVRRAVFKCRHQDHHLENIIAVVKVIDRKGEIREKTVSAGYCAECDMFFILDSIYQKLCLFGTPICRVSDEKTYLKGNTFINGMQLAQESILRQYGYSVSREEGLTQATRQKILSTLIDNNVLTASEVISYLDFFINQRQGQSRYEMAISKWEEDRDFVSVYRVGDYRKYGVNGLYRRY